MCPRFYPWWHSQEKSLEGDHEMCKLCIKIPNFLGVLLLAVEGGGCWNSFSTAVDWELRIILRGCQVRSTLGKSFRGSELWGLRRFRV